MNTISAKWRTCKDERHVKEFSRIHRETHRVKDVYIETSLCPKVQGPFRSVLALGINTHMPKGPFDYRTKWSHKG